MRWVAPLRCWACSTTATTLVSEFVGDGRGGPDGQRHGAVDRARVDLVAGADLDRHRFAGDCRGVDGGPALLDHPVAADPFSGADEHRLADDQVGGFDGGGSAGPQDRDLSGTRASSARRLRRVLDSE
jgi:hypothetical protein